MDKVLNAIKCHQCQNILNAPITLPCGHSICKQHTDDADTQIKCTKCGVSHQMQTYAINTSLLEIVDSQIGSMQFCSCYKEAKKACEELDDFLGKIDFMFKDPLSFSQTAIDQLKNRVLVKSEQLKLEIDENTDKILSVLDDCQKNFERNFNKSDFESSIKNLEDTRNKTEDMLKESLDLVKESFHALNQLKSDDEKWKSIKRKCECKLDVLKQEFECAKKLILMDEFHQKTVQVDSFVGVDLIFGWEIDSKILDWKQKNQLREICEISPSKKGTLLWRGSRDGFGAKDFHSRCDDTPKTLTIIETTDGYIFGGYKETFIWFHGYHQDPNAYIFSLVNDVKSPFVMKIQQPEKAIYHARNYGPTFGDGHDIHICDNSNKSNDSFTNITSYALPENLKIYPKYLLGTKNFQVKEIEVFQLELSQMFTDKDVSL